MLTSTRSTAGTKGRQSRRPCRRCTMWEEPARPGTSARRQCLPGSSPKPSTPLRSAAGPASYQCRIATNWSTGRPSASAPSVGATKPGHLLDATEALDVSLSDDEVAQLESRYLPRG